MGGTLILASSLSGVLPWLIGLALVAWLGTFVAVSAARGAKALRTVETLLLAYMRLLR